MDFRDIKLDAMTFEQQRSVRAMFKFALDIIQEIKAEHDDNVTKFYSSVITLQNFIKSKYNIDIELEHLINHIDYLDDEKMARTRKKILDFGNNLIRQKE